MGVSTKPAESATDALIDIQSDRAKPLSLGKRLRELLLHVPPEHLVGLGRISVVDRFSERGHADALGIYRRAFQRDRAVIELSAPNIFKDTPRLITLFPAWVRFNLAMVLYHEIGHHYEARLMHGVSKRDRENVADRYRAKMLAKSLLHWRWLVRIIYPIVMPILRLQVRRLEGQEKRR